MLASAIRIALAVVLVTVGGCEGEGDADLVAPKPKAAVEKKAEPERKERAEPKREPAADESAWLGVKHQTIDSAQAKKVGRSAGTVVVSVTSGSPAAKAGIKVGDVIFSFDGKTVGKAEDLDGLVQSTKAGKKVTVALMRGKTKKSLSVTTQARP
ncbi:MAG: PDZ domain-containing protein [Deltaproteobacteria bacterium]|nr:PDZ domain-containing protein [Deltaproteobacteria bacterium]